MDILNGELSIVFSLYMEILSLREEIIKLKKIKYHQQDYNKILLKILNEK